MDSARKKTSDRARHYKQAFSTLGGAKVLELLVEEFGGAYSTFDPANPHQTSFNEGQRSVVLYIKQMINFEDEKNG